MRNPIDFYDTYVHADNKETQARAIVQLLSDNIQSLATKQDLESLRSETRHMGDSLQTQIKFLDQKIDLVSSNLSKAISSLSNVMYGGFAVIFVALGYLIFKI